jgi:hypothetical protein
MNITLTREEAQQVLDALQCVTPDWQKAVETLRSRIAQPEPEPVAWLNKDRSSIEVSIMSAEYMKNAGFEPLYTAPPQHDDIYEEGCTPTDFRVLREANARMAQELFELRSKK